MKIDICYDGDQRGRRLNVCALPPEVLNNKRRTSFDAFKYPPWPNITVSNLSMTYGGLLLIGTVIAAG